MFVLPVFCELGFSQPSYELVAQNTTYRPARQRDRNIKQQNDPSEVEYDKVRGDARGRSREHIREHGTVFRFHVESSCCPHDAVDDKAGDDVADRGESSHTAHHSQRECNHALHGAHDRAAPESWHDPDRHDQKHKGKGRAYPPGDMQSISKDVCRGRNEPFREKPKVAAQRHNDKAPYLIVVHN